MRYRKTVYIFSALMLVSGIAADARDTEQVGEVPSDLTGYWQQEDGTVVRFTQDGTSLTSRHSQRSADNDKNDIDFTATVHGNLVYGAHRGPFSRAMQRKCALQIWVGMGLTLSADGSRLEGFRGDRTLDPQSCRVENSAPVTLVYKRMSDFDPMQ